MELFALGHLQRELFHSCVSVVVHTFTPWTLDNNRIHVLTRADAFMMLNHFVTWQTVVVMSGKKKHPSRDEQSQMLRWEYTSLLGAFQAD